jgi:hypothetical protein
MVKVFGKTELLAGVRLRAAHRSLVSVVLPAWSISFCMAAWLTTLKASPNKLSAAAKLLAELVPESLVLVVSFFLQATNDKAIKATKSTEIGILCMENNCLVFEKKVKSDTKTQVEVYLLQIVC